jgi:hypothetical protein
MDPRELPPAARPYLAADLCRPGSRTNHVDEIAQFVRSGVISHADADTLLGKSDATTSATREYLRGSQAFDAAVGLAMAEVPVPAGSLEKVLMAIAEAEAGVLPPASVELAKPERVGETERRRLLSRRGWLAACGSAAATTAAGFGLFAWWQGRQRPLLTLEDVLHQALAFNNSPEAVRDAALPITRTSPPAEFPLSPAIVSLRATPRWRKLDGQLLGRPGVAYELSPEAEPRAVMYVLRAEVFSRAPVITSLPTEPTQAPVSTGGSSLGAWREDDRLVVFVVQGDAARYRSFLTPPRDIA